MNIDYVHFYVEDAIVWRDWFGRMGFRAIGACRNCHTHTEWVNNGPVNFLLSAPQQVTSPVSQFLCHHPAGVVDVALAVDNLAALLNHAEQQGVTLLQPMQIERHPQGLLKWAQIQSWGTLRHTLIERVGITAGMPAWGETIDEAVGSSDRSPVNFAAIDHVVLNVAAGEMSAAVDWYERVLGLQPQQAFAIQTPHSGLCSRVMQHPNGRVKLPINEPSSPTSQIQEFLDLNGGAGVQHIALQTHAIVATIAYLRSVGLSFLTVPDSYYTQLRQKSQLTAAQIQALAQQQILVDWQEHLPQAVLMQIFTQPIFTQPTFFLELIERQHYRQNGEVQVVQGFGEGNFRALFEAIEQEQMKRGSLK
jgi:4-hydroxyphenylpyruvate dioxygenase